MYIAWRVSAVYFVAFFFSFLLDSIPSRRSFGSRSIRLRFRIVVRRTGERGAEKKPWNYIQTMGSFVYSCINVLPGATNHPSRTANANRWVTRRAVR